MSFSQNSDVSVIGSGFAGLAASAILGKTGHTVNVFEKNSQTGGRARTFTSDGFLFDMGPSWYWMPEVFEKHFNLFGQTSTDFYQLKKLDPGFKIIFSKDEFLDIPAEFEDICTLFENIEKGSAEKLRKYMSQAAFKYKWGIEKLVYKPGHSIFEYFNFKLLKDAVKLQVFTSLQGHIRQYFKDPRLISIMEFPVLFLGSTAKDTPALYSLMNHAELKQGTYYPMGGFGKVAEAFKLIAEKNGVVFHLSQDVTGLETNNKKVTHIHTRDKTIKTDGVIGAADYNHIEKSLLSNDQRGYSKSYWEERIFAPSCLIFYLGINKKIDKLSHHNLFFDEDIDAHTREIYKTKSWPSKPLFYVCCPSKTDEGVAPPGCENLFILMPVAIGLNDSEDIREHYFKILLNRLENFSGESIQSAIIFKKSYSVNDFENDYNAYKGNAYGLANTLMQTAFLKPKLKSKKLQNLFFAGQLTVPGPGVPPSIISGQVAANELLKYLKR